MKLRIGGSFETSGVPLIVKLTPVPTTLYSGLCPLTGQYPKRLSISIRRGLKPAACVAITPSGSSMSYSATWPISPSQKLPGVESPALAIDVRSMFTGASSVVSVPLFAPLKKAHLSTFDISTPVECCQTSTVISALSASPTPDPLLLRHLPTFDASIPSCQKSAGSLASARLKIAVGPPNVAAFAQATTVKGGAVISAPSNSKN